MQAVLAWYTSPSQGFHISPLGHTSTGNLTLARLIEASGSIFSIWSLITLVMLSINAILSFVTDVRVHYFIDDRAGKAGGPLKPWNADIMMLPLTATRCAVCTHSRVILIDSLHHDRAVLFPRLGLQCCTVRRTVFLYIFACLHLQAPCRLISRHFMNALRPHLRVASSCASLKYRRITFCLPISNFPAIRSWVDGSLEFMTNADTILNLVRLQLRPWENIS